jgi:hypothetical protein
MRAYVITTGTIFGLLTLAHLWRWVEERHLLTDPWHVSVTLVAGALAIWAWRLARGSVRS